MAKNYINPARLAQTVQYGFSQIVTSGPGTHLFLSGQVGWFPNEEVVGNKDLKAQIWQTLRNVETAVDAAGGSLTDVVSLRIYIMHEVMSQNFLITEGLQEFFPADAAPASTWIGVQSLARPEFLVEIEATAIIEAT